MAVWLVYRGIKFGQPPSSTQVFLNAAFLFGFSPNHYQSLVPAGWSLGVEMIFYAVLPALFVIVRDVRTAAVATVGALVLGFAFFQLIDPASSFQRLNFVSNLANFTGGLTAYFIYRGLAERPVQSRMRWSLSCLGVAGAIWLAAYVEPGLFGAPGSFGWRYFISAAFPPLILAVALYPWAAIVNRVTVCLGLLSYSVYLWHPFVITVLAPLRRRLYSIFPGEVWLPLLLTLALVASIAIAVSFLTYQFIERPALRLSFGTRKSAPVAAE
jgi:peptidoglycan/LPS O-acetylase OafA/YrhL